MITEEYKPLRQKIVVLTDDLIRRQLYGNERKDTFRF